MTKIVVKIIFWQLLTNYYELLIIKKVFIENNNELLIKSVFKKH